MTKHYSIILIWLFLVNTGKAQILLDISNGDTQNEVKYNLKIDSSKIVQKLISKNINQLVFFDKDTLSIPFNYSMKANNKSELFFVWQIGDLEINSQSDNYFSFGFEDKIPFHYYNISAGNIHLVWTEDTTAVTLSKVKNQLTVMDEIYYSDNQSLIYRKGKIINTLFFQYLNDKKAFAVYLSFNDYLKFSMFEDVSLEQNLELAIEQLALAKQFFKIKKLHTASGWEEYKKNLNSLNFYTIKESYEEVKKAVKSLSFNKFIRLEKMDISVMNLKTDNAKLWKDLQNFYSKKEINIDNSTFPNFKYTFGEHIINKIEYMDSNSIILYLEDPFNHPFYATIVKTKIQGNEVILATKNIETWVFGNTLKEMAYFYKDLFNHFGRL